MNDSGTMSKARILLFLLFFTAGCFVRVSDSANVLCMFTSPGKSHLIVFMSVANALIERGHNVTVITTIPVPNDGTSRQFRHIHLVQPDDLLNDLTSTVAKLAHKPGKIAGVKNFMGSMKLLTGIQWDAMSHPKLQSFLAEDNHFDLMILGYFNNYYQVGVAARYKCPIAVVCLGPPFGPINKLVGNPEEVSYVPMPIIGTDQPMTFGARVKNVLFAAVLPGIQMYVHNAMNRYYNAMFPANQYPTLNEVMKNVSLVLCNSHFTEMPIRPMVPALVEIGGIQIKDKPDPLPEKIKNFIGNKDTILFSLGSTARAIDMNADKAKTIFSAFSKLKQNVIWKWESDDHLPGYSPNILFSKWVPQDDLLANPNLKLFITHGGKGSIIEAQYHGVPMIGIPLYGDQQFNVKDIVAKGYGVQVNLPTLTEDSLTRAIAEVLQNPVYRQKVQKFSTLFRDRPMTAKETAAFWLEYVIRHNGAAHMQSPAIELNILQRWSIDVIGLLLAILYVLVKLAKGLVRLVRSTLLCKTKRRVVKNKND